MIRLSKPPLDMPRHMINATFLPPERFRVAAANIQSRRCWLLRPAAYAREKRVEGGSLWQAATPRARGRVNTRPR